MTAQKIVILSHNDLDGKGASTVLKDFHETLPRKKFFPVEVHNIHVNDVDRMIEDYAKDPEVLKGIVAFYILDLTPRKTETWDLLMKWNLTPYMPKTIVLDHHASELYRTERYPFAKIQVRHEDGRLACATSLAVEQCKEIFAIELNAGIYGDNQNENKAVHAYYFYDRYVRTYAELIRLFDTWDWAREFPYLAPEQMLFADSLNTLFDYIGMDKFEKLLFEGLTVFRTGDGKTSPQALAQTFIDFVQSKYGKEIEVLEKKERDYIKKKVRLAKTTTFEHEGRTLTAGIVVASEHLSKLGNEIAKIYDLSIISTGTDRLSIRAADPTIDVSAIAKTYFNGGGHNQAAGGTLSMDLSDCLTTLLHGQFREAVVSEE